VSRELNLFRVIVHEASFVSFLRNFVRSAPLTLSIWDGVKELRHD
jgi:hypothetical protein